MLTGDPSYYILGVAEARLGFTVDDNLFNEPGVVFKLKYIHTYIHTFVRSFIGERTMNDERRIIVCK